MAGLTGPPLAPGMPPMHTHVLAVVGDTARLKLVVNNLRMRGYQVTGITDPAAAMAGLRQDGLQGRLSFHVVVVDTRSEYPGGGRAAAEKLFEFAVREPQLSAYAINEEDDTFGPLAMEDLDEFMNPIYNFELNGPKSMEDTPNGRRAGRRSKKHISDTDSREVEHDGEHAEREQQQPSQKPKKARVVWTDELHKKFVAILNKLRPEDAVPKKILELMNDSALTRENIASHLQKYKLNLQREGYTYPLRRSHSRTKHHMSTPQASFPSPNMSSQQQAPPTVMQSQSAIVCNDHMLFHMQTLKTMDESNQFVLVDVLPKGMYPGDDDPEQNSVCSVGNSDDNSLHEDLSEIFVINNNNNKEPDP